MATVPDATVDVGIDATPLAGGHGARGIGRYLQGLFDAIRDADWVTTGPRIGTLVRTGQGAPAAGAVWRTRRAAWRPQDLDFLVASVADRMAVRNNPPRVWHHTDPLVPASPLRRARTLVTVYDLIPLRDAAVMAAIRIHRRVAYRRYLAMIRNAGGVIAISETTADDVVALLGVPRARVTVVPPHVVALPAGNGAGDRSASPGTRAVRLLFVGAAEPHKRAGLAIATLAELVRRGIDAELAFAGGQPPRARNQLDRLVGAAGLGSRVRFLGRIDDDRLARLYRESILLATSSLEGFGLPPIEAVVAGGRVVAAPIAAYRESLGTAGVIAAASSAASLSDAVEAASAQPASPRDRDVLLARFGSAAVAGSLATAYRALDA